MGISIFFMFQKLLILLFIAHIDRAIHDLRFPPPCVAHPVNVESKVANYNFFFLSKIWGHPTHSIGSTHTTLFPSDESNPRAKQIKNIHSFNCFIKPASPWIIYLITIKEYYFPLLYFKFETFS